MPAVVIKGPDEFLRSEAVADALEQAHGSEILRVDADVDNPDLVTLLDELRMKSLFSGAKAVVIEGDKFISAHAPGLAAFIKNEMPSLRDVTLVVSAEKIPAPLASAARKTGKFVELKKMYATDYNTGRPSAGSQFGRWLLAGASRMGLKMDREAVVRAIEASGEDTRSAHSLLKTLAAAGRKSVTAADIDGLLGGGAAAIPYRLEDAVLAGDIQAAMTLIDSAYRYGIQFFDRYTTSEGTITAGLMNVLVRAALNLARLEHDPSDENAKTLRLYSSRRARYDKALARLRGRTLELLLEDAFRAEFAFKAGIMDGRDLVEWLSARAAGSSARSPENFGEILARK